MRRLIIAVFVATLFFVGHQAAQPALAVNYAAGWNLVAGPTGTTLPGATALFGFVPGAAAYQAAGTTVTGMGYWVYYPQGGAPTFAGNPSSCQVTLSGPAGRWFLAGNPSATNQARISGVASSLLYDAQAQRYLASDVLQPGQGAWVLPDAGSNVVVDAGTCALGAGATSVEVATLQPPTCTGFATQADAQATYRSDPLRLGYLLNGASGSACPALPCPCDSSPAATLPPTVSGPMVVAQGAPAAAPSPGSLGGPIFVGCYSPWFPGFNPGPSLGISGIGGVCPSTLGFSVLPAGAPPVSSGSGAGSGQSGGGTIGGGGGSTGGGSGGGISSPPGCPNGFIPSPGNGGGPTLCKDGLCSHSSGPGTCSGHGGVAMRIGHSDMPLAA